jgi:hypothetical protein
MPPDSRSPPRDTPSTTCMRTLMLAAAARPASSRSPSCALAWSLYPPLSDPIHICAPAAAPPAPHPHRELPKPSSAAAGSAPSAPPLPPSTPPPRLALETKPPPPPPPPPPSCSGSSRGSFRLSLAPPHWPRASLYRELACSCTKRADSSPQSLPPDQPAAGPRLSNMVMATSCGCRASCSPGLRCVFLYNAASATKSLSRRQHHLPFFFHVNGTAISSTASASINHRPLFPSPRLRRFRRCARFRLRPRCRHRTAAVPAAAHVSVSQVQKESAVVCKEGQAAHRDSCPRFSSANHGCCCTFCA